MERNETEESFAHAITIARVFDKNEEFPFRTGKRTLLRQEIILAIKGPENVSLALLFSEK